MAYICDFNPKTKKELKEAIASGKQLKVLNTYTQSAESGKGKFSVEGPRYPKPHTWYASVETNDQGFIVKVK